MADAEPRRRGRVLRILLIIIAIIVLVPLAGVAVFALTFDPDSAKPRIEQAVKQATGRDLALNGRLGLKWSLWPTLEARDVALANVAGGSRPQMVTLDRLEAQVALLPLLSRRVEIDRLVLVHPDILLETDAQGHPNWRFGPEVPSQPLPGQKAAPSQPAAPVALSVQDLRVVDGTVTYRDGRTGHSETLALKQFTAKAKSADAPVALAAQASYRGTPFQLDGDIGPIARLQDQAATTPWPVHLTLGAAGAKLAVDGTLTQPIQGRGYTGKLVASIPDLAALAPFVPRAKLPPLHDVTLAAEVADTGGNLPRISALVGHVGPSDLGTAVAGLKLTKLDLSAPAMDQPVKLAAEGTLGATPATLTGSLGAPELLVPNGKAGAYPVDVSVSSGAARFSAKGNIADPRALSGVDLALAAHLPDLAAFAPVARRPLPALHDIDFQGRLSDGQGGLAKSAVLHGAKLTLPEADLAGDATLGYGGRPSLQATLAAQRIDADALMAALAGPTPAPTQPLANAPAPPPPSAKPPAPPREASRRMFSDKPLPFAALREADADLRLKIGTLRTGGVDYRDIAGHLTLAAGRLAVDPIGGQLPAGRLEGRFTADAGQANPPVSLVLRGPGLQLGPLLVLLGLPAEARGAVDIDADLHGAGQSAHALAASADGHLGVALVNGEIDNRLLSSTLGQVLQHARLPDLTARPGITPVRCFALRLDAQHGIAEVRALLLDTNLFYLEGGGSLNLGDETLALRLRPLARLGGTGVIVPLKVQGPFRNPKVEVDAAGAAGEAAGIAAQAARNPQLGVIIGALGGDRMVHGAGGDDCARQLAVARGGRAGPVPAAAPASSPAGKPGEKPKAPKPADILRQLFR
ncbi:MAG TPA: AsmA family protein [Acetobacteraceae bacterium]|nr:AsmA family protein [Acetobacteraceae bacterium]